MITKPREQVPLIRPTLESAIWLVQWLLVPCLATLIEARIISLLLGPKGLINLNDWVLAGGILFLVILHIVLVQLPAVKAVLNTSVGRIKRWVVLSCPGVSARENREWRSACWFIPEPYKQPLFRYDAQQRVVEQIVRRLSHDDEEEDVRFVYIEGESGQGKTRTIFLLLHALLKHPKLFLLANQSLLYDLADGHAVQELLCHRLDSIDHVSSLVFVDNFHWVEPEVLRTVTQKLLDTASRNTERLVVILGQPSHAWRIRPATDIRLLSTARKQEVFFKLEGVSRSLLIEELVSRPGEDLWRKAFGSITAGTASVPQLYFAQAVARRTEKQALFVRELLELLEGLPRANTGLHGDPLVTLIAVITALSMFEGHFSKREFWMACWAAGLPLAWRRRLANCFRMILLLQDVLGIGFVTRQARPRAQLLFHEAMAEHCKVQLQSDESFWKVFTVVAQWRLKTQHGNDPVLRWLLSCECHEAPAMADVFDRALLNGTLSTMVRCFDRNWDKIRTVASAGYQYALLLDQVGRFSEARQIFSELDAVTSEDLNLSDRVQIAWVEAEQGAGSYAKLANISQRGSLANKIAADYWRIHLDAHRGIFRPEALTGLAEKMSELSERENFEHSYFLVHTAARIFFDAHRHAYLVGERVEETLRRLQELPLELVLRRQLPQFRALSILYREAHMLAHVILPNWVFFGKAPTETLPLGKNQDKPDSSTESIIKMIRDSYATARDEFTLYGDRESLYLQADLMNFEMLQQDADVEKMRLKLIDYEAFIRKSAFGELMSYPYFYFFRWHVLQYFKWLEQGGHRLADGAAEAHLESSRECIQKSYQLDRSCGNMYGAWRAHLFLSLVKALEVKSRDILMTSLVECKAEAMRSGYWRDARLVQTLLDQPKITPLDIRRTILFFPFVHQ